MDSLMRGQLGPKGSGTVSSSVVSDSGSPFQGSSLSFLSSLLAYLGIVVHVLTNSLFGADAIVAAVAAAVALDSAIAEAIIISAAVTERSTAVVAVLVAPPEAPSAVTAVAANVVAVLVTTASGPHWRWL